jgi:CelD/BcsL family acetyltransferase involved in cellulose biosynthesis
MFHGGTGASKQAHRKAGRMAQTMVQSQAGELTVRTVHPSALTAEEIGAWQDLRSAHADYATPLLSPGFANLVGAVRRDARVTLIRGDRGLIAVLAHFRRPDGLGRPLGAPFADYSGPIVREGAKLSLKAIITLSGLTAWRSTSMIDPWLALPDRGEAGEMTSIIRPGTMTPADYFESRRALHPKRFKNFRRLERQALQDHPNLRFDWGTPSDALREQLFALKSAQYRDSGLVDLIHATHARPILDAVAVSPLGFQTSLWKGERLVSAHFGVREGRAFHPWISAYAPDFAHYSPGNLLLKKIIEHMPEMALNEYDLAEGHDHYKKYYTNSGRAVYDSVAVGASFGAHYFNMQQSVWALAGRSGDGSALRRLLRRIDHAAISERRTSARIADLVHALRRRRHVTEEAAHASARGEDEA